MKRTLLATLAISACIGSQVLCAATTGTYKVGQLTFALTDTYQWRVTHNGSAIQESVPLLTECEANLKYETKSEKITTTRVINAIGKALRRSYTSKAKLGIVNYDNEVPAPPYPPYLFDPAADTFNGPLDANGYYITDMWVWPNEVQIDWVEYDWVNATGEPGDELWTKASVVISDPNGTWKCTDVSDFFSFEEAYCYFCWDTVDRVTKGSLKSSYEYDICIGPGGCGVSGSGTTKFYLTIKFNNDPASNIWLNQEEEYRTVAPLASAADRLIFTVGGVVNYPWKIKALNGVAYAFGTMTMSKAEGYGQNPWCGVLSGSIKITETDDSKLPVDCYGWDYTPDTGN